MIERLGYTINNFYIIFLFIFICILKFLIIHVYKSINRNGLGTDNEGEGSVMGLHLEGDNVIR